MFGTQYPRRPCAPDRPSLHPAPANHCVRSAVQRISAALLDARLQRLWKGMHAMPYPAHPTSGPTTSRSPSVLGRSDTIESLHGSVISFVLLHHRLLRVNPLSCGASTMLHTRPTRHQMTEVVLMCACRCYVCKCNSRDRAAILPATSAAVKVHRLNHPRNLKFGHVVHAQQDIQSAAARAGLFPNEAGRATRMHAIVCGCSASAVRPSTDAQLAAQCTW